jgi:hypothetical protein
MGNKAPQPIHSLLISPHHFSFILQGECGYGPNLVVNGKIKNGVKGKDAVLKALGIEEA